MLQPLMSLDILTMYLSFIITVDGTSNGVHRKAAARRHPGVAVRMSQRLQETAAGRQWAPMAWCSTFSCAQPLYACGLKTLAGNRTSCVVQPPEAAVQSSATPNALKVNRYSPQQCDEDCTAVWDTVGIYKDFRSERRIIRLYA